MTLEWLAQLAQVLGGIAVISAIIFGITQLRQFQQKRRDVAALELMRIIQDGDFLRAFRTVYAFPAGSDAAQIRALGQEAEDAALIVGARFETLGFLVHRESIPYPMMAEMAGGIAVDFWRILKPWVLEQRREKNQPLMLEWFQWIAERLEDYGRPGQSPAYHRYRHWTPPKA